MSKTYFKSISAIEKADQILSAALTKLGAGFAYKGTELAKAREILWAAKIYLARQK